MWCLDIGNVWRRLSWRLLGGTRTCVVPGLSASSAETRSFGRWVAVVCRLSSFVLRLGYVSLLLLFSSCGIERPQRFRYNAGPVDGPMSCLFDVWVWSLNGKHEAPASSTADPGSTSVLLVFGVVQIFAVVAVMLMYVTFIQIDLNRGREVGDGDIECRTSRQRVSRQRVGFNTNGARGMQTTSITFLTKTILWWPRPVFKKNGQVMTEELLRL